MMSNSEDLVVITVSRIDGELEYKIECSSELSNEEFEYYLQEIIRGVCEWKKDVCKESIQSYKGKIKKKKK